MAEENEPILQLRAARKRQIAQRRDIAKALAGTYQRAHTENVREAFVKIQETIEAIDRAIKDEESDLSNIVARMSGGGRVL